MTESLHGLFVDLQGGDHVCAAYGSAQERQSVIDAYVAVALAAGRRTLVLSRDEAAEFYGDRPATDPRGLIDEFEQMAQAALADGHTGLAVAVDATSHVTTDEARAAFARLEHLADRHVRANDHITALCLFDARVLSTGALAELGVLHQQMWPQDTPFHFCAARGHELRLDGELDLASHDLLERSLVAAGLDDERTDVEVDASDLEYIDVRSIHLLADWAAAAEARLVLHDVRPIVGRLLDVTDVHHVQAKVRP